MTSEQIDALWSFGDPAGSCERFRAALVENPDSADEIHTQICRALGLQRKFDEGWAELALIPVERSPIVEVRALLEAGRLNNSSGDKAGALPYFRQSLELAQKHGFDFYAVDAAHMLGIATSGAESLEWNERAIRMATESGDLRAQGWNGSLLNNTGWTYHDMGEFEKALEKFEAALAFRQKGGKPENLRIARWCVGRCLRSMGRLEEALTIQRELELGPEDGFVSEELGELLLATGDSEGARVYFRRAFEKLSADPWLTANEADRLNRLEQLSA